MFKEWNDNNYFDVLKGIGILSIVVGHACYFASNYVYSYHLALFFFISGFLYSEKKYGHDPFLNISNRLKNNYPKYFLYSAIVDVISTIFHRTPLNLTDYRNSLLNSAVFVNTEPLFAPTWFILALICASSIFGGIIYFGNYIKDRTNSTLAKNVTIIILGIFSCMLGEERMYIKFALPMRLDIALFVIPIFIIAYFIKTYIKNYIVYLKWYVAVIFFFISVYLAYKKGWVISLVSQQEVIDRFFILSILGIYQCMYLAKFIFNRLKYISKLFSFIGKYTFEIMAFHFTCFKIIDFIYTKSAGISNPNIIQSIPFSYKHLWPVYVILGCLIPAICISFLKNTFNKYKIKR